MAVLEGFDASTVPASSGFDTIPDGWYTALITKSELKACKKDPSSNYLELTFAIQDSAAKGRLIWDILLQKHPSAKAIAIAQGKLAAICKSVNVLRPKNSEDLHNIPIMIKVGLKKRDNADDKPQSEIKGYKAYGSAAPAAQSSILPPVQVHTAEAGPAGAAPQPWNPPTPGSPAPWGRPAGNMQVVPPALSPATMQAPPPAEPDAAAGEAGA